MVDLLLVQRMPAIARVSIQRAMRAMVTANVFQAVTCSRLTSRAFVFRRDSCGANGVKKVTAAVLGILLAMPDGAWAQESDAPTVVPFPERRRLDPLIPPVPVPWDEARPKIIAAEIGKRVAREGCVIK